MNKLISPVLTLFISFGSTLDADSKPSTLNYEGSPKNSFEKLQVDRKINWILQNMSLREKVGQLFLVGIPGTEISSDLQNYIQNYHPGGFVLFGRNIQSMSQVANLNQKLRSFGNPVVPPLIAVDEEGGLVTRIATVPPLPNALAIGQTKSIETAEQVGRETGRILRGLGFNMNLAPVLDVADPEKFSFIGQRSFGSEPSLVGEIGAAVSRGYFSSKILPTAKHFPGTGSTTSDPHKVIASQAADSGGLFNELESFSKFLQLNSPRAVMMSHLKYPSLDSGGLPATYSHIIISDLLRKKLKFNGLVITDDLQMNSSKIFRAPEDGSIAALNAGADIIMLAWSLKDQKKAMNRALQAIKTGEISSEKLNEKLRRIIKTKLELKDGPINDPHLISEHRNVVSRELRALNAMVLSKNLFNQIHDETVNKNKIYLSNNYIIPWGLCFFSSLMNFNYEVSQHLKVKAKFYSLVDRGENKLQHTIEKEGCETSIISILGSKTALQAESLNDFTKTKIILINLSSPFLVKDPHKYRRVINLYFPHAGVGDLIGRNLGRILLE